MTNPGQHESLIGLAKAQRWLLLWFSIYIVSFVLLRLISPENNPAFLPVVLVALLSWICMITSVVSVTRRMSGWVWALVIFVLMLLPLVNLVTLLAVNVRAVSRLREGGYKVGFMGVSSEQLKQGGARARPEGAT